MQRRLLLQRWEKSPWIKHKVASVKYTQLFLSIIKHLFFQFMCLRSEFTFRLSDDRENNQIKHGDFDFKMNRFYQDIHRRKYVKNPIKFQCCTLVEENVYK